MLAPSDGKPRYPHSVGRHTLKLQAKIGVKANGPRQEPVLAVAAWVKSAEVAEFGGAVTQNHP